MQPDRMRADLDLTGGLLLSESVAARLAPALGREQAHELVRECAGRAEIRAARSPRCSGTSPGSVRCSTRGPWKRRWTRVGWTGETDALIDRALDAHRPTPGDCTRMTEEASMDDDEQRHEQGMRIRREVLGDAHVDRAAAGTTPLTADFQDFITRYAWGEVWARPGLDRRMRSAITVAVLTALDRPDELTMHLRAALRNGLTREEIAEVLLHTAVYAGVPTANRAFALAREALADEES